MILPQIRRRKKYHVLERRLQLLQRLIVMRRQKNPQDVIARGGCQQEVLLDAAPRLEQIKFTTRKAGLRQSAQLFHTAIQLLVERVAQQRLRILVLAAGGWNCADGNLGVRWRRAGKLQQRNASVACSWLRHRWRRRSEGN